VKYLFLGGPADGKVLEVNLASRAHILKEGFDGQFTYERRRLGEWPQGGYRVWDVFVHGDVSPEEALRCLKEAKIPPLYEDDYS
jgi:hypothetical protein